MALNLSNQKIPGLNIKVMLHWESSIPGVLMDCVTEKL